MVLVEYGVDLPDGAYDWGSQCGNGPSHYCSQKGPQKVGPLYPATVCVFELRMTKWLAKAEEVLEKEAYLRGLEEGDDDDVSVGLT